MINFTFALRKQLPNHIIIHSLLPYLMLGEQYPHGGYLKINRAVGHLINFYQIIYDFWAYDNYTSVFIKAPDQANVASIKEITMRGIPLNKMVIRR